MFEKIDLHGGNVIYDEFKINLNEPAETQKYKLQEDLIQIKYYDRYLVDVGWKSMLDPKGYFIIVVIEDRDWYEPLLEIKVHSFKEFIPSLQKAIDFLIKFVKENPNRPLRETAFD